MKTSKTSLRSKILFLALSSWLLLGSVSVPAAFAAGSITPSGGGSFTNGSTFTITVRASGATFDSLQGTISVTGPVSIVSFSPGSATWLPGKSPANNNQFVGIVSATSSLTVATIRLRGTKEGGGKVTVSGVRLAKSGSEVGTGGGSTSFTITRAPTPPGGVAVSSSSHPNPEESYEATTLIVTWEPPSNGASGYSYVLDQAAETIPPETILTTGTTATIEGLKVGTHYFHIRAKNNDGWGGVAHFRVNIRPAVDNSLPTPVITEISTVSDYQNDIESGTLTGIIFKGTGASDHTMNLTFTPELGLPKEPPEKYAAPVVDLQGNWQFSITDPVKAGFYKLVAQAQKEGTVSPPSETILFEVSVAEGGKIRRITSGDTTEAYKQKEAARVAAANTRQNTIIAVSAAGVALIIIGVAYFLIRRRMLNKTAL